MATNFAYRKRQLELEKKRKKEEKLKRKQEQKASGGAPELDEEGLTESDEAIGGGADAGQTDAAAEAEQGAPSSEGTTTSQPER